ncbi:Zn-ribbon domain-containing OB-fold protein [Bacillus piscicola]|uniref:Zn-ribbon domain-containing OB-fold protein n=1 Tax=Bacillus piscicola TaxID=1632684 RepID=UPI001F08F81D|nr:OB-fold domain-containing protein [Bacillus piscicola]
MDLPIKRCTECDEILYHYKYLCQNCFSDQLEDSTIEGKGSVYSYTKIHAAPKQFAQQAPYFIVLVEMEQGLKVTGRYEGEDITINDSVELSGIKDDCYYFKN